MSTQPQPEQKLLTATPSIPVADVRPGMVVRAAPGREAEMVRGVTHTPHGTTLVLIQRDGQLIVLTPSTTKFAPITVALVEQEFWRGVVTTHPEILTRSCPTIGADPEIFVVDENDEVIPAFRFLPPKEAPLKSVSGTQFYDGFQAEWTTTVYEGNPACLSYHADTVRDGMAAVLSAARQLNPRARLSLASSITIPRVMQDTLDDEHFQLGCSPSENVYGEERLRVKDPRALPYRSAGWHMHFGFPSPLPEYQVHAAVRMLDRILSVAMVSFAQAYPYPDRRRLYGRAGEFRYRNTLEYRVPEVILGAHPSTWNLWWDIARIALWMGMTGMEFLWDAEDDEVRHAINKSDVGVAQKILKQNEPMLRKIIERLYCYSIKKVLSPTLDVIFSGIDTAVARPMDLEGNWKLGKPWAKHNNGNSNDTTWVGACGIICDGGRV